MMNVSAGSPNKTLFMVTRSEVSIRDLKMAACCTQTRDRTVKTKYGALFYQQSHGKQRWDALSMVYN